jgi:hypothetical protein
VPLCRRVFPVEDLVTSEGKHAKVIFALAFGKPTTPSASTFQLCCKDSEGRDALELLVDLIQKGLEPESWTAAGGAGTVEYWPVGKSLVVSQTAEIQDQVQELLNALRRVQVKECAQGDCCSRNMVGTGDSCQMPGFNFSQAAAAPVCQAMAAPKPVQTAVTAAMPSIILIQQPNTELAELAVWMFSTFAEWACDGSTETKVLEPQGPAFSQATCANCPQATLFATVPNGKYATGMPTLKPVGTTATGPAPLPAAQPTFHVPTAVANGLVPSTPATSCPIPTLEYQAVATSSYVQALPTPLPSPVQACVTAPAYPTALPTVYTPPPAPPTVSEARTDRGWSVRANGDTEHPSMSVRTDAASMECDKMTLKWRQNSTLSFVAEKDCVRIRGKNFEARAEAIECREQDGKLLFVGNATLRTFEDGREDCVLKAKKIIWDSTSWMAEGAGSLSSRRD